MPDIPAVRPAAGAPVETVWGQQVHDRIEGIQTGYVTVAGASAVTKSGSAVFPFPYSANPIVVATAVPDDGQPYAVSVTGITTTGVTVTIARRDGVAFAPAVAVAYVAIGLPQ
jgi:hypothetical protein